MRQLDEIDGRVTLSWAANRLGVTTTSVRRYIEAQRIRCDRWEDRLMLYKEDVERLASDPPRQHAGRPRKATAEESKRRPPTQPAAAQPAGDAR